MLPQLATTVSRFHCFLQQIPLIESGSGTESPQFGNNFFCLGYEGQDRVPMTDADKEELLQAGLKEREVEFESLERTPEEFKALILKVVGFNY